MVGIVLVSHSPELAGGLAELARQMAGPDVTIEVAGGGPDGRLGTDGDREADAKSLLAVLALGARRGATLRLRADGDDASVAVDALASRIATLQEL